MSATLATAAPRLTVRARRGALRLAYANGALWAVGNGLTSSLLVLYLAMELDVPNAGLGMALILAAPQLAGVLRLGAPALIGRLAPRKRFCLAAYAASAAVLLALPWTAAPGWLGPPAVSLAALTALWAAYQVLEYLGSVALWSWLADLAPSAVRGRFLGRRERWMALGQATAMLASGGFLWLSRRWFPDLPRWIGYAIPATLGAGFMLAALVPLAMIPSLTAAPVRRPGGVRSLLAPLGDPQFLRFLAFGCAFSLVNGLIDVPQSTFPKRMLGIEVGTMLWLKVALRLGQMGVGPRAGVVADRLGNRPVMVASVLLLAQAPLCYFFASPEQTWWIAAAWAMMIAWVGLNIAQPNFILRLSPRNANAHYIAVWFAVTGLCFALGTIAGGLWLDRYRENPLAWFGIAADGYRAAFLFGWLARGLCVLLLLRVVEPQRQ